MTYLAPLAVLAALLLLPPSVGADVVTTTDGLRLEGEATRAADGRWVLVQENGRTVLEASRVAHVQPGEGPREVFAKRLATLDPTDVPAWIRFALEADAVGLSDLARGAYEHVIARDEDHAVARRALGHERVDGAWVSEEVARRRRGLVLYEGTWVLPAEVEARARTAAVPRLAAPSDDARTRDVIRTLAGEDELLRRAARLALAQTPQPQRVRAALGTLYDREPRVRRTSAALLGEIGDEAALRPLILSAARDVDPDVRREAVRAAAAFGHDDLAVPFVRALGSAHPRLVANAAEALAAIGDQRAIGYVVKRMTSHGSSTRNFVSFLNQVSYVRDYDVEIAQASNIANPDVSTISEGVILDVKVVHASFEKTWIEPLLVDAASALAGQRFADRDAVLAWYAEHADELPDFPQEGPPARKRGQVIGAQ